MSTLIRCPRCGHACGNEVDYQRQLTLRCQFCLYTGDKVTDGRHLMNVDLQSTDQVSDTESPK